MFDILAAGVPYGEVGGASSQANLPSPFDRIVRKIRHARRGDSDVRHDRGHDDTFTLATSPLSFDSGVVILDYRAQH